MYTLYTSSSAVLESGSLSTSGLDVNLVLEVIRILDKLVALGLGGVTSLTSAGGSWGLSIKEVIPVSEGRGEVANEVLVVIIVVIGTSPNGKQVAQTPGEVVSGVGVDSLDKSQSDPDTNSKKVHVTEEISQKKRRANSTDTGEGHLEGVSILSSQTEGGSVLVVLLVNTLVKQLGVEGSVTPIVPSVLNKEEDEKLPRKSPERGKGGSVSDVEELTHEMETENRYSLDEDVGSKNILKTLKVLLTGGRAVFLDLVFAHRGYAVKDHPGKGATEVDTLVDDQEQDTSGKDIIIHVVIPGIPFLLQPVEVGRDNSV